MFKWCSKIYCVLPGFGLTNVVLSVVLYMELLVNCVTDHTQCYGDLSSQHHCQKVSWAWKPVFWHALESGDQKISDRNLDEAPAIRGADYSFPQREVDQGMVSPWHSEARQLTSGGKAISQGEPKQLLGLSRNKPWKKWEKSVNLKSQVADRWRTDKREEVSGHSSV